MGDGGERADEEGLLAAPFFPGWDWIESGRRGLGFDWVGGSSGWLLS